MNAAIIDTDVVSMLFKGDSRAQRYRTQLTGRLIGISFMTLAELERWQLERRWGAARKADLAQHLTKYVVLPAALHEMGGGLLGGPTEGPSHPDCRRLDRSQCAVLSGTAHHEQWERLRNG